MRGGPSMKGNFNQGMDMGPPGMGPPPNMPPMWDGQGPPGWGRQQSHDGPPGWDDNEDEGDVNEDEGHEDLGSLQMQNLPLGLPSLLTMKIDTPEEFRNKNMPTGGVVLPKALEEALAYKDQRQAALGDEGEQDRGKEIFTTILQT